MIVRMLFIVFVLFCVIVAALAFAQIKVMRKIHNELHHNKGESDIENDTPVKPTMSPLVARVSNDVTEKWKETLPSQSKRIKGRLNRNKRKRK